MLRENFISDMHIVSNQISNLINTPIEQNFERLARMAKRMFDIPVIAISFLDEKRQLINPVVALDLGDVSIFLPFFNEFDGNNILVVEDATKHPQLKHHKLVVDSPKIRFFVNCPIFEKNGRKIGSLIMLDYKARPFGLTDLSNLNDITNLIESEINDFRLSKAQKLLLQEISHQDRTRYIDTLTRAWNYEGCKKILQHQLQESQKEHSSFALVIVDVDNLSHINQQYGKAVGDEVLTVTSRTILRSCRDEDTIARGEDEDFVVIVHTNSIENVKAVVNRIKANMEKEIIKLPDYNLRYNITIGVTFYNDQITTAEALMQNAKIALLKGKRLGRNRIEFN